MKNTKTQKPKIKISEMSFFIFSQKLASLINEANNIKLDDFKKYYSDLILFINSFLSKFCNFGNIFFRLF